MEKDELLTIFCNKFEKHGSQWDGGVGESRTFCNSRGNGEGNSKRASHHMFGVYLRDCPYKRISFLTVTINT